MAKLKVFWNYVTALKFTDLSTFDENILDPSVITEAVMVVRDCRGIYYRTTLSDELDFNQFLSNIKLEDVRKARNEPSNSLLFHPKCKEEKSIGVLRIVKPKRFSTISGQKTTHSELTFDNQREFEVILESTEFVLEEAQEQMAERYQLQETFGDFNVFFFGKRAEIFTYSGSLLNAAGSLQWKNQFLDQYERFLRGSRCAELKARAYLLYDDVIREGFILSAGTTMNSLTDSVVKFYFTLLVTAKRILGEIPKTRTGTIVLKNQALNTQGGIDEIQFIRAVDPQLPGVQIGSEEGSLTLTQNDKLPGTSIPADLEALLRRKSLDALNNASDKIRFSDDNTVIDRDILIDFIPDSQLRVLARSTARLISGTPDKDIDNLTGQDLVNELISVPPSKTVDDLSLEDAVKVADSLSQNDGAQIGGNISDLISLSQFFSKNGVVRVSRKVAAPLDFKTVIPGSEDKQYVLDSAIDKLKLNDLITLTAPLISPTLPESTLKTDIVGSTPVSIMSAFLKHTDKEATSLALQAYAAIFCLVEKPVGGLFGVIITNFPNVDTEAQANALSFVQKQKIKAFKQTLLDLTPLVSAALNLGLNELKSSGLYQLISAATGTQLDDIYVTDATIKRANTIAPSDLLAPAFSSGNARFLTAVGILVTGLIAELARKKPVSVDALGGVAKDKVTRENFAEAYLTKAAVTSISDFEFASSFPENVDVRNISQANVLSFGGKTYLILPLAFTAGSVDVDADIVRIIQKPTSLNDRALHEVGIYNITQSPPIISGLANGSIKQVSIKSIKRKNTVFISGSTFALRAGGGIAVFKIPINQRLISGAVEYGLATIKSIASLSTSINDLVSSGATSVVDEVESSLTKALDSGKISDDEDVVKRVLSVLDIKNFDPSVPSVSVINGVLKGLGITVGNVFDLLLFYRAERVVADNLKKLKTAIQSALDLFPEDIEKRAEIVADSDNSLRDTICP